VRFLTRRSDAPEISLYVQRQGPNCYRIRSPHNRAPYDEFARELLSSSLAWYWTSSREPADGTYDNQNLPDARPLTYLAPNTVGPFISDLRERTAEGYARWFYLFGADPDMLTEPLNEPALRSALKEFSKREAGPISMVIIQEYDDPFEFVFVLHGASEDVNRLLEAWGVNPASIRKTYPYEGWLDSMLRLTGD
jgi:hypothetical protein